MRARLPASHRPLSVRCGDADGLFFPQAKPLADPPGSWAVALLNREEPEATISLSFADLPGNHATSFTVEDLNQDGKVLGVKTGSVAATVAGTAAEFYKLAPKSYA